MLDINDIDAVFSKGKGLRTFTPTLVSEIRSMQQKLGGKLFFHRLLEQLQIPASALYPPNGVNQLRELHGHIVSAPCQEHHKQSLLYYLAKDLSQLGKEANFSEDFQAKCNLPQKYLICMQGFWCLDRMKFKDGVEFLTHPSLVPVFSAEVLDVLLKADERELALAYYHATEPNLDDQAIRERFFRALCEASITEAYFFMRSMPATVRSPLLEILVETALDAPAGEERKTKGTELVELPLSEEEACAVEAFLSKGKGRGIHHGKDALLAMLLARGRYDKMLASLENVSVPGTGFDESKWESVKRGVESGIGERPSLASWKFE